MLGVVDLFKVSRANVGALHQEIKLRVVGFSFSNQIVVPCNAQAFPGLLNVVFEQVQQRRYAWRHAPALCSALCYDCSFNKTNLLVQLRVNFVQVKRQLKSSFSLQQLCTLCVVRLEL